MMKPAEPEGAGLDNNQIPTSMVQARGFARSNCMCQSMTNYKLSARKTHYNARYKRSYSDSLSAHYTEVNALDTVVWIQVSR